MTLAGVAAVEELFAPQVTTAAFVAAIAFAQACAVCSAASWGDSDAATLVFASA